MPEGNGIGPHLIQEAPKDGTPQIVLTFDVAGDKLNVALRNCSFDRALDMLARAARSCEDERRMEVIARMQDNSRAAQIAAQVARDIRG